MEKRKDEREKKERRKRIVDWLFCFTGYQHFWGHLTLNLVIFKLFTVV